MTNTSRITPTRMIERVSTDRAALYSLLDEAVLGHVGFVADEGQPVVLPIAIARDADRVLLHGSTGSRWLRLLAQGVSASLAITELDALVVARSAFESSMRYRSAVVFGRCTVVSEPDKPRALDILTDALIPGRVAEVRRPTPKELAATLVLALAIEDFTVKVSQNWPDDPPSDVAGDSWAGVLPRRRGYSAAWPAPDLAPGTPVPASVQRLVGEPETAPDTAR